MTNHDQALAKLEEMRGRADAAEMDMREIIDRLRTVQMMVALILGWIIGEVLASIVRAIAEALK